MNPEAQRIAIAEACPSFVTEDYSSVTGYSMRCQDGTYGEFDPLNDLNAMHAAEALLFPSQSKDYDIVLHSIVGRDSVRTVSCYAWHASAAQRAEAFLRAVGKWEGE